MSRLGRSLVPGTHFDGRVAVVTGGSRGIGREVVQRLAERGAHVVVASRKLGDCQAVADGVAGRFAVRALPVKCNVSSWDDCDRLVDVVYETFGSVDVLVNNAGLSPRYDSLDGVSESLFDKVVAVNLRGPFRLTSLIGSRMMRGSGGVVVNVGSVEATRPSPDSLPYAASKAGLAALSKGFARAFGPTVRVNTIEAGPILTDVADSWPADLRESIGKQLALGRCGEPGEVADAVMYLASDEASFVSGATLNVDGGYR
ncbi:SDR family NAD(P)-dependent oxidoreductase [Aeromicrobium sp. CTD01-1L150]|uniref:SDR family NAD(P)-dependent oxidoreductase n=1 Tax=Aeromicrobium sp. CTD01-1L150 TaxID=3341830 RepID=UPI0035C17EFC